MRKIFYIIISLLFLVSSSSIAFAKTTKCQLDLDNFSIYKVDLFNCLKSTNKDTSKYISNKIKKIYKKNSNYLSSDLLKSKKFIINDELILSEKFNEYLSTTIKENYLDIYGIHKEFYNLKKQNTISELTYNNLVNDSLFDFSTSCF